MRIKDLWRPLYDRGLTDIEIAKRLSCSVDYIAHLRGDAGLPGNQTDLREALFQALYDMGYCDRHIADERHCTTGYVSQWRRRNGLPPNKETYHRDVCPSWHTICRLCRWYYRSDGCREYACCDYLLRTGKRRGCKPPTLEHNECARFEPQKK